MEANNQYPVLATPKFSVTLMSRHLDDVHHSVYAVLRSSSAVLGVETRQGSEHGRE